MRTQLPETTAGGKFDLLGNGSIRVYRYMKCADIKTYRSLSQVNKTQFNLLMTDKIDNTYLAVMSHYHVQDQKYEGDFTDAYEVELPKPFPQSLKSIRQSPFISVTLHPWLALTGRSLDSLIVSNDCIVELMVPVSCLVPTTDKISTQEGELLLLLPPNLKFQELIVKVNINGIYGKPEKPDIGRQHLREKYGIKGGLVKYSGRYFTWNWIV